MIDTIWVDAKMAEAAALGGDAITEQLRTGHGYLNRLQFANLLRSGKFQIIVFRNNAAALVAGSDCEDGRILNILTVRGNLKTCEAALPLLEEAAKNAGYNVLVSTGHLGWCEMMERHGYTTKKLLLMRKVLQ